MSETPALGLVSAAKGTLATLVEMLLTRLQLLGVDLEEQGQRLLQLLLLSLMAAILLVVGLTCTGLLVALWLWDTHRALAVAFVLLVPFGGSALCTWLCMHRLRGQPRPFSASLAELGKDLNRLRADP